MARRLKHFIKAQPHLAEEMSMATIVALWAMALDLQLYLELPQDLQIARTPTTRKPHLRDAVVLK